MIFIFEKKLTRRVLKVDGINLKEKSINAYELELFSKEKNFRNKNRIYTNAYLHQNIFLFSDLNISFLNVNFN